MNNTTRQCYQCADYITIGTMCDKCRDVQAATSQPATPLQAALALAKVGPPQADNPGPWLEATSRIMSLRKPTENVAEAALRIVAEDREQILAALEAIKADWSRMHSALGKIRRESGQIWSATQSLPNCGSIHQWASDALDRCTPEPPLPETFWQDVEARQVKEA